MNSEITSRRIQTTPDYPRLSSTAGQSLVRQKSYNIENQIYSYSK